MENALSGLFISSIDTNLSSLSDVYKNIDEINK